MKDMNNVAIIGRLTRDAELKHLNNGDAVVVFSMAVNVPKKNGDTWSADANFFDAKMYGKAAESVHKYLTKGKQIGVSGELRQERWEQDGNQRSKVVIKANDIELLRDVGEGARAGGSAPQGGGAQASSGAASTDHGDDIPF